MHWNPRGADPQSVRANAAYRRERLSKRGASGMPTIVLIALSPLFLLMLLGKGVFRLYRRLR